MKLSISPGHYPESPGKTGRFKQPLSSGGFREILLYEHYEVLSIMAKIKEELCLNERIQLFDTPICVLPTKVKAINESGADLAIEVHMNSFTSPDAWGPLCIAESKKGKDVALNIFRKINQIDQIKYAHDRVWNCEELGRKLYFILQTKMPAVIVECFFLTNKSDLTWWLQGWSSAEIMGQKISQGIIDSLNLF